MSNYVFNSYKMFLNGLDLPYSRNSKKGQHDPDFDAMQGKVEQYKYQFKKIKTKNSKDIITKKPLLNIK